MRKKENQSNGEKNIVTKVGRGGTAPQMEEDTKIDIKEVVSSFNLHQLATLHLPVVRTMTLYWIVFPF